MEIRFRTKSGYVLETAELSEAARYYDAACTAEFIAENYALSLKGVPEGEILNMGYAIREKMADNNETEEETLYEYMPEFLKRVKTGMPCL